MRMGPRRERLLNSHYRRMGSHGASRSVQPNGWRDEPWNPCWVGKGWGEEGTENWGWPEVVSKAGEHVWEIQRAEPQQHRVSLRKERESCAMKAHWPRYWKVPAPSLISHVALSLLQISNLKIGDNRIFPALLTELLSATSWSAIQVRAILEKRPKGFFFPLWQRRVCGKGGGYPRTRRCLALASYVCCA